MDLLDYLGGSSGAYNAYPSFQTSRRFESERLLKESVRVPGSDYQGHLDRAPPSKSPGVDIDVTYPTERAAYSEKPTVLAPSSGEVVFAGGKYGTVTIRDNTDHYHKVLHMEFVGPVEYVKVGDHVEMGDPIGVLGDVHPTRDIRDHVHYSVYSESGTYFDPERLNYDVETGAVTDSAPSDPVLEEGGAGHGPGNDEPINYDNTDPLPGNIA